MWSASLHPGCRWVDTTSIAVADPANVVPEVNELNNTTASAGTFVNAPDFAVSTATASPAIVDRGQDLTVTAAVLSDPSAIMMPDDTPGGGGCGCTAAPDRRTGGVASLLILLGLLVLPRFLGSLLKTTRIIVRIPRCNRDIRGSGVLEREVGF